MELLTLTPDDRYLRFLIDHPSLVAVPRQRDIASYIRVTPAALSRIKSRLSQCLPPHHWQGVPGSAQELLACEHRQSLVKVGIGELQAHRPDELRLETGVNQPQ